MAAGNCQHEFEWIRLVQYADVAGTTSNGCRNSHVSSFKHQRIADVTACFGCHILRYQNTIKIKAPNKRDSIICYFILNWL